MAFYLSTHTVKIALIGDSILAQMAPRQSMFYGPLQTAQNLGVSGATLAQIYNQVGSIAAGTTHVVLDGGTNDLLGLGTDFNVVPGYAAILNTIPSSIRVIVMGIPQVDEDAITPSYLPYLNNSLIHMENVRISDLCRTYSNCVVASGVMAKPMRGKTADGIHPTATADVEITRALVPLLGL